MKPFAIALAVVVVALGGVAVALMSPDTEAVYQTVPVERGDLEKTVTALGALRPRDHVNVGAQVSGQLTRVHVEIGDRVEKGQLLAEIDPRVYESRVQSSEANLERLKAHLAEREAQVQLARAQLERNRRLSASHSVSAQTLDESEASLKVAEAQVRSLQAEIKAAESALSGDITNLGYTKIYAPMSGTVVSESSVEGQTVNASQTAPEIVTVADLDTMTVWAEVSEADVVRLKVGMPAWFTTLGTPDRRWHGEVRQIQPTPQIVNDVVLYYVLIDVDNREQILMRDMTVQVFFVLDRVEDAVLAPFSTVHKSPGSAEGYTAQVLTPDGPELRSVRVGLANRSQVQVLDGLAVGEKLIVGPHSAGPEPGGRPSVGARL
ncbi:efflux RND transporter periplasmic adaptor subunit [Gilvimarinus sp. F26214L]|uniref:efflux RND transporter periplasmic adaptor subunit n=1 Tax=Gilvimarinus sp. DZF01 TaxID=3461371 RepID=UPI0040457B0A